MRRIFKILMIITATFFLLVIITYLTFDEPLPKGKSGPKAEELATKMLKALNKDAYDSLGYIEWTFPRGHQYQWFKAKDSVIVKWDNIKVHLNTKTAKGIVISKDPIDEQDSLELVQKAYGFFINDSFWLIAPFKVRDPGTIRKLVSYNGQDALLVTYSQGGVTPGDSYLWILDENYKPKSWKFWVEIIPIGGIEFSWEEWRNVKGALISTVHTGPIQIDITNLN